MGQAVPVAGLLNPAGRKEVFVPKALRHNSEGEAQSDEALIAQAALFEAGPTALILEQIQRYGKGAYPFPPFPRPPCPPTFPSCAHTDRASRS